MAPKNLRAQLIKIFINTSSLQGLRTRLIPWGTTLRPRNLVQHISSIHYEILNKVEILHKKQKRQVIVQVFFSDHKTFRLQIVIITWWKPLSPLMKFWTKSKFWNKRKRLKSEGILGTNACGLQRRKKTKVNYVAPLVATGVKHQWTITRPIK